MSYMPVASAGSAPGKQRPGTVTTASALLYLVAALQIASIGVSFLSLGATRHVIDQELNGTPNGSTIGTAATVGIIIGICVAVVFAVGTVVLGVLVGRGKNPARIVTWVLGGIGVLCYGCGLAGTAVSNSLADSLGNAASDPQTEQLQQRLKDAVPGWQTAVSTAAQIVLLLLLLAVIILLALPASNDFFRKEQEVWVPPTWAAGTPGGYPPAPGYPGGAPGSPGYPGYPAPPPPGQLPPPQ
jgi:hypothetical protein